MIVGYFGLGNAILLFEIPSMILICLELHYGELRNSCLNGVFEEGLFALGHT